MAEPAHPATYPPLDQPKPVAEGLWIVDSGPLRVLGLPLPVRMTVLRLRDGGLWLHSPTRHTAALQRALQEIGPIRHLVAPNVAHWSFLQAWQRHCPEARIWAAPELRRRRAVRKSRLRLDHDLAGAPPPPWAGEIEQRVVPGAGGFREVAFFHQPSRSLLLTDLVQKLEPGKLPPLVRPLARLAGVTAPEGGTPAHLRALLRLRRREAAEAARQVLAWQPERVIFAHGAWFERDGTAALQRALSWLLR